MTTIVGLVADKMYMGSDSRGTYGYERLPMQCQKIFRGDKFLMGGSGNYGFVQHVFRQNFSAGSYTPEVFIGEIVIPFLLKMAETGLYKVQENENNTESSLMIMMDRRIFGIFTNLTFAEQGKLECIGSGAHFARGSMETSSGKPEDRVRKAIQVAKKCDVYTGGKVAIESL